MSTAQLVRLTLGVLILIGLLFWRPLAWLVGIMLIFAGITGVCLLEKLFIKLGAKGKCGV